MSRALALRGMALHLTARAAADLQLTSLNELAGALRDPLCAAARGQDAVVLLGASTPSLAASLLTLPRGGEKRLTIVEPHRPFFDACLRAAEADRAAVLLHADPTDLRVDPRVVDRLVAALKPADYSGYAVLRRCIADEAQAAPLLADGSVDLVIIDLLLNRLRAAEGAALLAEAFRVLRRGGRLLCAALAIDEPLPAAAELDLGPWRALRLPLETEAGRALESAGFHAITYQPLLGRPLRVIKGVEVRAFLLDAYRGKDGICLDQGHAVIYRGPWREVLDDDGHRYARGERTAVCAKTHDLLMREPYRGDFISLPGYVQVPLDQAPLFDCNTPALRDPAVTKGRVSVFEAARPGVAAGACCGPQPDASAAACAPGGGCCG